MTKTMRFPILTAAVLLTGIAAQTAIGDDTKAKDQPRVLKNAERIIAVKGGGYFPVMIKLNDGSLAAVLRGGAGHVGLGGRLDVIRSTDGGHTWSKPTAAVDSPWDDRNPAFGQMPDGTLVLGYSEARSYRPDGTFDLSAGPYLGFYVTSSDGGATWSAKRPLPEPWPSPSPFGKIIVGKDGTAMMSVYRMPSGETGILRSKDNGKTWGDYSQVFKSSNADETQIFEFPDGRLTAFTRLEGQNHFGLLLSESDDHGRTWPRRNKFPEGPTVAVRCHAAEEWKPSAQPWIASRSRAIRRRRRAQQRHGQDVGRKAPGPSGREFARRRYRIPQHGATRRWSDRHDVLRHGDDDVARGSRRCGSLHRRSTGRGNEVVRRRLQ